MIQYVRGSGHLALTLEADDGSLVKLWVDVFITIASELRSQNCGMTTLGRGLHCSFSLRQRLNIRNSIEAELVTGNDFMPLILWTRDSVKEQRYKVRNDLLYQNNRSALLSANNGKCSSGKQT